MRALVTNQGTAAAETMLCEDHVRQSGPRKLARDNADYDVNIGVFVSIEGNEESECIICGAHN